MWQNLIYHVIASALVMKRNLDWHRRIIVFATPLFIIFMLLQSEYIIYRIKNHR